MQSGFFPEKLFYETLLQQLLIFFSWDFKLKQLNKGRISDSPGKAIDCRIDRFNESVAGFTRIAYQKVVNQLY